MCHGKDDPAVVVVENEEAVVDRSGRHRDHDHDLRIHLALSLSMFLGRWKDRTLLSQLNLLSHMLHHFLHRRDQGHHTPPAHH
jgi:hypothetical protein